MLTYLGTMVWYAAIVRLDLARTTAIVVPSIPVLSLGATFVLLGDHMLSTSGNPAVACSCTTTPHGSYVLASMNTPVCSR